MQGDTFLRLRKSPVLARGCFFFGSTNLRSKLGTVLVITFILLFSDVGDGFLPRFLTDVFVIMKPGNSGEHKLLSDIGTFLPKFGVQKWGPDPRRGIP